MQTRRGRAAQRGAPGPADVGELGGIESEVRSDFPGGTTCSIEEEYP